MTDVSGSDQLRRSGDIPVGPGLGVPKASALRHTVFVVVLSCLVAAPAFLFMAPLSTDSTLHSVLAHMTPFGFPLWSVFAVWVTLDASTLYRFVGGRLDPFGPKALSLSALGPVNIASMFLFLVLTK